MSSASGIFSRISIASLEQRTDCSIPPCREQDLGAAVGDAQLEDAVAGLLGGLGGLLQPVQRDLDVDVALDGVAVDQAEPEQCLGAVVGEQLGDQDAGLEVGGLAARVVEGAGRPLDQVELGLEQAREAGDAALAAQAEDDGASSTWAASCG